MLLLSGPNIKGNEWKYVKECLDTEWVSSVGSYVTRFEEMLAEFSGTKFAVATSSGTTALHTSLNLLGVQREDLVIVPNITFVASMNSIKYTGAGAILMDVDTETWQMDLDLLEKFFSEECEIREDQLFHRNTGKRIPVIMPVHVLGNMCNMKRLVILCEKNGVKVLEDSTESLGSYYDSKHSGSFGTMGCFSFNGNKIITCGGGGMIVTDDEDLAKRAKHITTQAKADRMEYYHDEIGYNYRLTNVAAAIGVGQMEQLPSFLKRKKEVMTYYMDHLAGCGDIQFQKVEENVDPNWWLITIKTQQMRVLLDKLNENKLQSRPFWIPMNKLPMFKDEIYYHEENHSEKVYKDCISIPSSTNITNEDMDKVIAVIKSCY